MQVNISSLCLLPATCIEGRSITRLDSFRQSEGKRSQEFDEDLGSQRDDTDPVLRNSPTDGIVQVHNEDNQTEFDNFAAGYVQTEINALWTVDWTNFIKKSSFRIHFL